MCTVAGSRAVRYRLLEQIDQEESGERPAYDDALAVQALVGPTSAPVFAVAPCARLSAAVHLLDLVGGELADSFTVEAQLATLFLHAWLAGATREPFSKM